MVCLKPISTRGFRWAHSEWIRPEASLGEIITVLEELIAVPSVQSSCTSRIKSSKLGQERMETTQTRPYYGHGTRTTAA